ncbi:MAG TPA: SusC/RagA family TonB-linked outer membrane protein [Bacteroidales bacterium]|nr:SusC/RagA family TonB-linked outer membrane protein [Bacteroidales bacterium]
MILVSSLTYNLLAQKQRVTLSFENAPLLEIMDAIEKETGYFFLFNEKLIETRQSITLSAENQDVSTVLHGLFDNSEIRFTIIDDKIILSPGNLLSRLNQLSLFGYVVDELGIPMPGVNIHLEGTKEGTNTDEDGRFSILVNSKNPVLLFSFIGYTQQRIVADGKGPINLVMKLGISNLEEVVVVGYGTIRKSDLTGAIIAVRDDEYKAQPVSRVDEILQGRSAGVNVTNVSGAPGGITSIRIRGANSITGNNDPLYVIDGFVGGNMADVNPTDIESIQILKDASSTAIYGSRGANGVILITTKRGVEGTPRLSFSGRYFTSSPVRLWPLLNAEEFALVSNARADALEYPRPFSDAQIAGFKTDGGTDWQDLIYRRAPGEEIQLDYSGGSQIVNFFISANYLDQGGILINSYFKRYSLRANLEARLSGKLTGSLKINFSRRENNNTIGNFTTSSIVAGATAWSPTTPAYDQNGKLTVLDPVSSTKSNPVELATNDDINESNAFITNASFRYDLLPGLKIDLGAGVNYNNNQTKRFNQRLLANAPSASRSLGESVFLQNTNMITYTKEINNNAITLTGVAEYQLQQNDYFSATATNLLFPSLKYYNLNLARTYSLFDYFRKSTIGSYIGRLNYTLMNKYLVTASIRSDRSSKFRGINQRGLFPSIGLGWRISEENFLKGNSFLTNLKLRGSWGQTGSQAVDVYGTVTTYNTQPNETSVSWQNGTLTPGINIGNPGNENLKWETTTQSNIGLDIGFLKDRFTVELDYFYKVTKDILLNEPLPGYVGGGSIFRNVGSVRNSGVELTLNSEIINNHDISWDINFNFSSLKNEVLDLGGKPCILQTGGAGAGIITAPEMILKPGYSISTYYGFRSLGIWQEEDAELAAMYKQQPGDYRYEDINGDYAFTGEDFQIIGSGIPRFVIGVNNTLKYKNFTLNAFFQSMLGYEKWNFAYAQTMIASADAREYTHKDILNRWSPDNTMSRVAAFSKTNVPRMQSSEYVESGNYIRMKNISLQYLLPEKTFKAGSIMASISAQNLLTFTKYKGLDPETYSNVGSGDLKGGDGGAYPNARTWTFGLTISF